MIVVLGSGVAGISAALAAADAREQVLLVTPGTLSLTGVAHASDVAGGNTALAQGGIAAALGPDDLPSLHATDTEAAGAGLVDAAAATLLCEQGAAAVQRLVAQGFQVDRLASGELSLGLEAAHSRARIVHAGEDRAGAALHTFLLTQLRDRVLSGRVQVAQRSVAVSLLTADGAVSGVLLRDEGGHLSAVRSGAVMLATGGYASLFSRTSNHSGARGQGIMLAAQVGAVVADLEFVQFHPTVLAGTGSLVSEAVRGAGAVLRDDRGERFMRQVHEAAELAPRDIVSRAAHRVLLGGSQVWLDATGIEQDGEPGTLARRFPAITAAVHKAGFDWAREPVPVAPAAHYSMGGVVTDLDGRTSVQGLFAAGEVASTGVHGANRLASNSLLEGLVFGAQAARTAVAYVAPLSQGGGNWRLRGDEATRLITKAEAFEPAATSSQIDASAGDAVARSTEVPAGDQSCLEAAIDRHLGIEREAEGLAEVERLAAQSRSSEAQLARWIARSAEARTESRGAHYRSDFAETDSAQASRRSWRTPVVSVTAGNITSDHLSQTQTQTQTQRRVHSC